MTIHAAVLPSLRWYGRPMTTASIQLPVLWGDLDALGHVNNARFFTWFESARIALFGRIGVLGSTAYGPILATTTCDFLVPVHFPATIEARATVTRVGESSITMAYEVVVGTTLHARGTSVAVLVEYPSMKKVRVPDDIRTAILAA